MGKVSKIKSYLQYLCSWWWVGTQVGLIGSASKKASPSPWVPIPWQGWQGEATFLTPFHWWTGTQRSPLICSRQGWQTSSVKECVCVHARTQSCPALCDPLDCSLLGSSVHGIARQEYWSGWPFPPPGDLPDPGIEPGSLVSLALAGGFFTTAPPGKPSPIKGVMVNILNFVARLCCCRGTKATTGNNTCMCYVTAVFQQSFVYRRRHVYVLWFSWVRKYYSPFDLFQPFKNNENCSQLTGCTKAGGRQDSFLPWAAVCHP